MAEYIDNGVKAVGCRCGLGIMHTDESPDVCAGVIFKKSGIYSVSLLGNFISVSYVAPNDSTCVGCRYNIKPGQNELSNMCLTCSRRCKDHYEKEEK